MRYTIVVLALVALGAAIPQPKQRAADQSLLNKQQECIDLLLQITGDIPNEQLNNLGQNYDIQANAQHYDNPTIVKYYANIVQQGLVQPKGTPYSSSISQLRKEVSLLYYILLGAQDYQTFVKTAAWARIHVNEVQFLKAFSAAILQRQDTQGIILPAMYEILPQYFFDARIIQEVQNIEAKCIQAKGIQNPNGQNDVIIPVNYTAYLPNGEHELSYFTQDVGIQSYYKDINLAAYILEQQSEQEQQQQQQQQQQSSGENQQSLNGDGSRWLYLHQQLLARYQLNRLGSGLGPIQDVNYENIGTPFQPHLRHLNGLELPGRFENVQPNTEQKKQLIKSVKILELRLIDAIDSGFVKTTQGDVLSLYQPQGLNILGEIIKGTGKSINPRYYGSLQAALSQLLGNAPEVENIWDYSPSVLELQTTAVRDPAFYQLWKKVLSLLKQYQESLPAYQYNNLLLQGVTIDNVHVSPLVTYFDNFYVNLGETTPHPSGQQGHIKAQLKRLDHKPYEYQIKVNSQNPIQNAVVRVFLGPKYNSEGKPISISQQRQEFVELDQFIVNLQPGQNIIDRKSHQAPGQSYDYPSIDEIQQSVNNAIRSQEPLYITPPQQILGFPARLSLPKGTPNGLPLQMLVMISGPGQISPSNGPVIPEKSQTYQQQQYQVVTPEQYQQIQVQQSLGQSGVQKTVEVLPQQNIVGQQNIQVAQSHYGNLYTKTRGQMHAQWQVGQGHQGYDQYPQQQIQNQQQGHQHQQQQGQQGQYQYGQLMQQQPQYQYGQHVQQLPQFGGQQQQQQQSQQQQPQQQQQGHSQQWQQVQHPQQWQEQQQYKAQQQAEIQGGVRGLISGIQAGLKGGVQLPVGQVQGNLQAGVHGLQGGVSVGLQSGADSGVQYGTHVQGYQQVPWSQGMSSGQIHAGGYQGIQKGQGQQGQQQQQQQDSAVNQLLQNKHITEIIGGAISLDGKPFGYPLDRPLALGALQVPNIYVQNVHIVHEGEPTNEISQ